VNEEEAFEKIKDILGDEVDGVALSRIKDIVEDLAMEQRAEGRFDGETNGREFGYQDGWNAALDAPVYRTTNDPSYRTPPDEGMVYDQRDFELDKKYSRGNMDL